MGGSFFPFGFDLDWRVRPIRLLFLLLRVLRGCRSRGRRVVVVPLHVRVGGAGRLRIEGLALLGVVKIGVALLLVGQLLALGCRRAQAGRGKKQKSKARHFVAFSQEDRIS